MESKSYKQLLSTITTFILDIDGVLTDGTVHVTSSGELLRTMNVKDGYALKTAIKLGYHICIISGGKNEGVKIRLQGLGIQHIYHKNGGQGAVRDILEQVMKVQGKWAKNFDANYD